MNSGRPGHELVRTEGGSAGTLGSRSLSSIGRDAQSVLDRATDHVAVLHPRGHLLWATQSLLDLVGDRVDYGTRFSDVVHPDDVDRVAGLLEAAVATPGAPIEASIRVWASSQSCWVVIDSTFTSHVEVPGVDGVLLTARDVTIRTKAEAGLRRAATRDPLTSLPNRALLQERLAEASARARRRGTCFGVLFLDLDGFKQLNDTLGHAAGDRFLVDLARRMRERLRAEDTLARLGGDEFVIVTGSLDTVDPRSGVEALCRVVLDEARVPVELESTEVSLSASIGVVISDGSEDARRLLRDADAAMYQAKARGRAGWVYFDETIAPPVSPVARIQGIVARLLESSAVEVRVEVVRDRRVDDAVVGLYASPVLEVDGHEVSWTEATGAASDSGAAADLAEVMIRSALEAIEGVGDRCWLSVPVTPHQLVADHFIDVVSAALTTVDLTTSRFVLSMASSELNRLDESGMRVIRAAADHGIGFCVADFGTGPADLDLIRRLPVVSLAIHESFGRDLGASWPIVDATVGIATAFGIEVIACGIDDSDDLDALAEHGVFLSRRI